MQACITAPEVSAEFTATEAAPVTVNYCKAGIPTGQTIRVEQSGNVTSHSRVEFIDVTGEMVQGNAKGKAKASGARCVFLATKGRFLAS